MIRELFEAQYAMNVSGRTETVTETRTVRVGESLGNVVTSGYCNCSLCCGSWAGGPTASGAMPRANHTIAVDANNPIVPMGTKIVMNGVEYTVEDAIKELATKENNCGEYEYQCMDGSVYRTFTLQVIDNEIIIVKQNLYSNC